MLVHQSLEAFREFASRRGHDLDALDAATCVADITDWYGSERAEDVELDEDGDMLLFQWGTYDWGDGSFFVFDLTRQLIVADSEDDDEAIWQLSCELRYRGGTETETLQSGSEWCSSPAELADFRSTIMSAPASAYAQSHQPITVGVRLGQAG